jgi:hypothetical protein
VCSSVIRLVDFVPSHLVPRHPDSVSLVPPLPEEMTYLLQIDKRGSLFCQLSGPASNTIFVRESIKTSIRNHLVSLIKSHPSNVSGEWISGIYLQRQQTKHPPATLNGETRRAPAPSDTISDPAWETTR